MIVFPNCKINLGLFVTDRRTDGYHSIESLFLPVPWTDILEVIPDSGVRCVFSTTGLPIVGEVSDNLVVRAWQLMHDRFGIRGVQVHVHKEIPMGAGLGGGSSDGAFMLKALNTLYELNVSEDELEELAASLGSDCPFFIRNIPTFVSGRGEVLEPIATGLFDGWIALIHPTVHVGTAEAYSLIEPQPAPVDLRQINDIPFSWWQEQVRNDFEAPIVGRHASIHEARQRLLDTGAGYVAMSGSGSAVFGLFTSEPIVPEAKIFRVSW